MNEKSFLDLYHYDEYFKYLIRVKYDSIIIILIKIEIKK